MKTKVSVAIFFLVACTSGAFAENGYIKFDDSENMIISGPFEAIIPKPDGARIGGPEDSTESFMDEKLAISKAGYFADDQMVIVRVETTNAPAGTLTNENLPTYDIGGQEFRARTVCIDISQEELDSDNDPFFEFIEGQNVQVVPAVQAVQLSVVSDDGTGEGSITFLRNVAGGCDSVSPEFMAEFEGAFGRFIESIQGANE
jgi:hypothetical protein